LSATVTQYLRTHTQEISDDWERTVLADLDVLVKLERAALLDHLPEVLEGLAAWVDGATDEADHFFEALADGHALQRLGFGIELGTLIVEYAWLRRVVLERLESLTTTPELCRDLTRLNEGFDRAVTLSIRRYSEERDQQRDRFIGILGHDLRTPLQSVSMATHVLLRSKGLAAEDRKAANVVAKAVVRMERLIADVLEFARGQLGAGIPSVPSACDMGVICRVVVEEARAACPDRSIELSTRGDLQGTWDESRVHQALGNLVRNAVEHGQDPITVTVWEADDREAVFTRVVSHGPAIPDDTLRTLFDAFSHVRQDHRSGLGLGLYIVAQIARAHGAACEVTSSDRETAFTIRWARAPRAETPGRP
jgi:signal transduction histidine kinase